MLSEKQDLAKMPSSHDHAQDKPFWRNKKLLHNYTADAVKSLLLLRHYQAIRALQGIWVTHWNDTHHNIHHS